MKERKDYDGPYEIALRLRQELTPGYGLDGGYFHLYASPVKQYTAGENIGKVRNFDSHDALNDLRVYCQGNNSGRDSGVYAWEVEYHDVYTVRLDKAEKMAKLLKQIDKKMGAIAEQEGPARSYGQYVNRVARSIGAAYILEDGKPNGNGWGYDGLEYRRHDLGDAVSHIDWLIRQWEQAGKPAEVAP